MSESPGHATDSRPIEIDFFRIEDAPGIAGLFREVYGDGYPIRTYYSPEQLIEENAAGHIISSVARTATGKVVGHDALILLNAADRIYENGAGAVLSAYRGRGIFPKLFRHSIADASKRFGVETITGEPVCNHPHMQKMCLDLDFMELGMEVDLMPASAYTVDPNTSGRVSVLVGCFKYKLTARSVQIPPIYRSQLEYLYTGFKAERTFIHATGDFSADKHSRGRMNLFDSARVARIAIEDIGPDFESFIAGMGNEAGEKGMLIFQVWLPLASPSAPAATDILRGHGYFLGGIQPCLADGDGLLMQKVAEEPLWERMMLYSERAKKIGEMVMHDWKCVTEHAK